MKYCRKIFIVIFGIISYPIIAFADPIPMINFSPFSAIDLPQLFFVYVLFGSVIEVAVAFAFATYLKLKSRGRIVFSVLISNLIFYPIFWFVILPMLYKPQQANLGSLLPPEPIRLSHIQLFFVEILVVLIEAVLIYVLCNNIFKIELSKKIAAVLSLTINLFSFFLPVLIQTMLS